MRHAVVPRSERSPTSIHGVGIGLRLPHLAEVATALPSIPWLEVHPENFLANPHARELLQTVSEHYPISLHTVGISIGSADGIDKNHLRRIQDLIVDIDPVLVSGHLAWSTFGGNYLNDLLPIPYDEESLSLVASRVHEVQDAIGCPYLVENPANYVGYGTSTLAEIEFLRELVARTDCRLLCDVSNVIVSGSNMGFDPFRYIDEFPMDAVQELHLGGFTREVDESLSELLIDTHDAPISSEAWGLYAYALRRFGPRPTLIEWDNSLPALSVLLREADRASDISEQILGGRESNVAAG
jgi:hypothetical protein